MIAAFASWAGRIAPVFDAAHAVHIVEVDSGRIVREADERLRDPLPTQRALQLSDLGVGTLICGAISRPVWSMVASHGIRVIPFITGDLREVIEAWLGGGLRDDTFTMPGCGARTCGRPAGSPGLWRGRGRIEGAGAVEPARKGRGRVRGEGRGGKAGRTSGPPAGGPGGDCVCIRCGHRRPHERGIACGQTRCPACGAAMARE